MANDVENILKIIGPKETLDQLLKNSLEEIEAISWGGNIERPKWDGDFAVVSFISNGTPLEDEVNSLSVEYPELVIHYYYYDGMLPFGGLDVIQNGDYLESYGEDDDEFLYFDQVYAGEEVYDATQEQLDDKTYMLQVLKASGEYLYKASDRLKNDREVVLTAVTQDGSALGYASLDLRKDREIVLAALKNSDSAIDFVDESLHNDREIVMTAISRSGNLLTYLDDDFLHDHEVVLTAAMTYGGILEYASVELKNDREVVLAAVTQNGSALQFASKELQDDFGIVMIALDQNFQNLRFASDRLKADPEIIHKYQSGNSIKPTIALFLVDVENIHLGKMIAEDVMKVVSSRFNIPDFNSHNTYQYDDEDEDHDDEDYEDEDYEDEDYADEDHDDDDSDDDDSGSQNHQIDTSKNNVVDYGYFVNQYVPFAIGFYNGVELNSTYLKNPLSKIDYFKIDQPKAIISHEVIDLDWSNPDVICMAKAQYVHWTTGEPVPNMPTFDGSYGFFLLPKELPAGSNILITKRHLNILAVEVRPIPENLLNQSIGILNIKDKNIRTLEKEGFRTIRDILVATPEELGKVSGYKTRSSATFKELESSISSLGLVMSKALGYVKPSRIGTMSVSEAYHDSHGVLASEIDWHKFFDAHPNNPIFLFDTDPINVRKRFKVPMSHISTIGNFTRVSSNESRDEVISILHKSENRDRIIVPGLFRESDYYYYKVLTDADWSMAPIPDAPVSSDFPFPVFAVFPDSPLNTPSSSIPKAEPPISSSIPQEIATESAKKTESPTSPPPKDDPSPNKTTRSKKPTKEDLRQAAIESVKESVFSFYSVDIAFKKDKSFMLEAVQIEGTALGFASDELKNDYDVVSAAVTMNPHSLQFASDERKNDHDIVMIAVSKFGTSLRHASSQMKRNLEIIKAAVAASPKSICFADRDYVMSVPELKRLYQEHKCGD